MKKIVTILGARPQFVKAAVLSRVIGEYKELEEVIVHTGQHYDANMSDVFFEEMNIPKPAYFLNVNGMGHGAMTGEMIIKIEEVLIKEKPDAVVVYGDTNSTLAGALAAKKIHIPLIHVEAGLRSFNMKMPEEVNRVLTDRISDLMLCPTDTAIENLKREGRDELEARIVNCGDIMGDSVAFYSNIAKEKSTVLKDLELRTNEFILATIHRQENTDISDNLKRIFEGLEAIGKEMEVIMPLHPRTKNALESLNESYAIRYIEPVGYFDMLQLLKHCKMVVTDSGGLQKEAFFNKKHCIIAREETEWVELVMHGFATIVGPNKEKLISAFRSFKKSKADFSIKLYGEQVGEKIYQEILNLI